MKHGKFSINPISAERIKSERKRLGFTQAEAALCAGVTRDTWGTYERGTFELRGNALSAFIAAGADADYLVTGVDATKFDADIQKNDAQRRANGAEEERLVAYFRKLGDASQKMVVDMAQRLAVLEAEKKGDRDG